MARHGDEYDISHRSLPQECNALRVRVSKAKRFRIQPKGDRPRRSGATAAIAQSCMHHGRPVPAVGLRLTAGCQLALRLPFQVHISIIRRRRVVRAASATRQCMMSHDSATTTMPPTYVLEYFEPLRKCYTASVYDKPSSLSLSR